jgi:hypothetical protein
MRRVRYLSLVLLAVGMAATLSSCRPKAELCCLNYSPETDQATYCNNHRIAVDLFVLDAVDSAQSRERLSNFADFYNTIKDCQTIDCIEHAINADSTIVGFLDHYQNEHDFAELDTDLPSEQKAELALCGFKHAIDARQDAP